MVPLMIRTEHLIFNAMLKKFVFIAAIAAIAASCSKEIEKTVVNNDENDVNPASVVFTAGIDTKAAISGSAIVWEDTDQLTLWNGTQTATYSTTDSGASATFTTSDSFDAAASYTAIYPADGSASFSAGSVTTTLPAVQTATDGNFDPAAHIAVATTSTTALAFHNAVAYLKFTVPSGMDDLVSVTFAGNNSENVAGACSVNTSSYALTATGSATAKLSGTFDEGHTYYLAIAPQNFSKGYTVTIERTSDTYDMVSNANVTFDRNNARNIGDLWDGTSLRIKIGGSAIASTTLLPQTLENENLYAAVVNLVAGNLTISTSYTNLSIAPSSGHDYTDGGETSVVSSSYSADKYISITADGTYRIIYNNSTSKLTIQSPSTFVANKSVSYNNTVDKINPYVQDVAERIWMYGGFNGYAHDDDISKVGFQRKYTLLQSAANPYLFVYKGETLPRNSETFNSWNTASGTDPTDKANPLSVRGCVFLVSCIENNVYAWGASGTNAKRNTRHAKVTPALDEVMTTAVGQSDNRYALFEIPTNANYVELDIDNNTVVFKKL